MTGITKWFITGHAAAAEHDAVANLIDASVVGFNRNAAFDEDSAADVLFRILQNLDGRGVFRFVDRPVLFNRSQSAGGALVCGNDRLCMVKFAC